jgi:signal transduction histidine kinase
MKTPFLTPPARLALIYLVVAALWILFSDQLLAALISDASLLTRLQTIKGWMFVTASALLLYWLARRDMRTVQQKNIELQDWSSKLEERVAERTAELKAANAKLREVDHLKSKLISEISHELRTPVTSVNLKLDLLGRVDTQKQQAYVAALKEQVHQLGDLIEDVMDLSWLTEDETRRVPVQVDLNQLASNTIELHRPMADVAGLSLNFQADPAPVWVWGHPQQLSRMLSNLVANAIKFTPKGKVQVIVSQDQAKQAAAIQIQDTGIGIPPGEQPLMFNRLFRGEQARKLDIPGTGLGLSIVKGIIDAHRGDITVESQVNEGTTFIVRLPMNSPLP